METEKIYNDLITLYQNYGKEVYENALLLNDENYVIFKLMDGVDGSDLITITDGEVTYQDEKK